MIFASELAALQAHKELSTVGHRSLGCGIPEPQQLQRQLYFLEYPCFVKNREANRYFLRRK